MLHIQERLLLIPFSSIVVCSDFDLFSASLSCLDITWNTRVKSGEKKRIRRQNELHPHLFLDVSLFLSLSLFTVFSLYFFMLLLFWQSLSLLFSFSFFEVIETPFVLTVEAFIQQQENLSPSPSIHREVKKRGKRVVRDEEKG